MEKWIKRTRSYLDVHSYALPGNCASGCRYIIISVALEGDISIIYKEGIGSRDLVMIVCCINLFITLTCLLSNMAIQPWSQNVPIERSNFQRWINM